MKNTIDFILDYAKVSPDTAVKRIINATDRAIWAVAVDLDKDCFQLTIFNPFEGEDVSTDDENWCKIVLDRWIFREK